MNIEASIRRVSSFRLAAALLSAILLPGAGVATGGPLNVELEDLRPGLAAEYRSLNVPGAALARIDAKPAFSLGHSSPHPRLPSGPFEVTWTGVLVFTDSAPVSFDAFVCGEVKVDIDGTTVLTGRGERETERIALGTPLDRPPGLYRITIRYRSLPDLPARLQLWWQGPSFSREPLPAWNLKHAATDVTPAVAKEQSADRGRTAVGQLGCARCHQSAFPGVADPPPGPSLADAGRRIDRAWLLDWLADPAKLRPEAHMPALFTPDRIGFVERWLIADQLLGAKADLPPTPAPGDHRMGRRMFISTGCAACHLLPDLNRAEQPDYGRTALTGLAQRLPATDLAAFLSNPHSRYPDGRMPRLPITSEMARDVAAYLLLWPGATAPPSNPSTAPTAEEIRTITRRLRVRDAATAAGALIREKRCAECHPGLGPVTPGDVPITAADDARGCLSSKSLPRYTVNEPTRRAIADFRRVAALEKHASPFAERQRQLDRAGCVRCHQRDSDRPSPLEAAGSTLGGAWLMPIPYLRAPRLTDPHQKYTRAHLNTAVREGVTGLRSPRYTYLMPAYGPAAAELVQAIAEGDGELASGSDPQEKSPTDPTIGSLAGPTMVGSQGYGCVSCHVWNGQTLSEPDPGAMGPDLTRVAGRIRRDWFDRYLEAPTRSHPGTPMPAIFAKGKPASLPAVLDGDPARQKDALWAYFALGKKAPSPAPPPPVVIVALADGPRVAQAPVRLPDGKTIESISLLYSTGDLIMYDVGTAALHSAFTGAQILRGVQGRIRTNTVTGTPGPDFKPPTPIQLVGGDKPESPTGLTFHGYDRIGDGVRIRRRAEFSAGAVEITETLRLDGATRTLVHELSATGIPAGRSLEWQVAPNTTRTVETAEVGGTAVVKHALPAARPAPASPERTMRTDPGPVGSLERPGYRAIAYPRPKTATGEDLIMPAAVAVDPKNGRVFVASFKTGAIYTVHEPTDDARSARFDDYAGGVFQDTLSMLAEPGALYVPHRRNLTRITDTDGDGKADRFDRVFALPHGVADTYDYAYGLVRDRGGAFVLSYAPYANRQMPGSGSAVRLVPGRPPEEVAFGFRNPIGWSAGTDGEVFWTDNQGEWVATNRFCHLTPGRYFGFPNPEQKHHTTKQPGKTTVWVPYAWAKSLNGATCDTTGGKFGPFAGQFFLAELMFGGAIIRVDVEKVNGEYQGACFPFWGPGLLGPLTLAFDPKGRLYVGGITEPGWMAQPDRGALFRIDHTGDMPFEMKTIRVLPRGFRVMFTRPVSPETARDPASYKIESHRYEYTGAYGSPELDRTSVKVERVDLAADGLSADLTTVPLVKDRVYMIHARGVRSGAGEPLVHPMGAYTLNEIPGGSRP